MIYYMNLRNMKFDKSVSDLMRMGLDLLDTPALSSVVDDKVAIRAGDSENKISLAVPGIGKGDMRLTIKENKLFIYLKEKLFKTYYLTKSVDKESIGAHLENGLLEITFHRQEGPDEEEIKIT